MTSRNGALQVPSSSHRLPTVSASQALKEEQAEAAHPILFGLDTLDRLLYRRDGSQQSEGGLQRGKITEIYGPPGAGKTVLCIQACASALHAGGRVTWVDTATRIAPTRLKQVISRTRLPDMLSPTQDEHTGEAVLDRFSHYYVPTLSHLLALLLHPVKSFPPTGTSLIVVDSLSALIDSAYPRGSDDLAALKKNEHARWLSGRRQAVIGELANKLTKLAVMKNVAVLITNYATTKIRAGARAILRPALTGQDWEKALGAGIILLRGWWPHLGTLEKSFDQSAARLAGVVEGRSGSTSEKGEVELAVQFVIEADGVREILPSAENQATYKTTSPRRPAKRPHAAITGSDGDESGSEYGWADDDQLAAEGLVDDVMLVNSAIIVSGTASKDMGQNDSKLRKPP